MKIKRQYKIVVTVLIITLVATSVFGNAVIMNDCKKEVNSTDYSNIASFDNHPPYQPTNPNPENGSTSVDINVDISWSGGDPDGDPVTYDVYFGMNTPPPIVESNQSNTTYDPGTLNFNTSYYWQIIAWDNHSAFNTSPVWEFTTKANNAPELKNLDDDNPHWWCPSAESYELRLFAIDYEGHNISYWVDWGDGHNTGWLDPSPSGEQISINHTYYAEATYIIKAKAKDTYDAESSWEELKLNINISELELKKNWLFMAASDLRPCGDYFWIKNEMGFRLSLNPPWIGPILPNEEIVISKEYKFGITIDLSWIPDFPYYIVLGRFDAYIWKIEGQ